MMPRSKGRARSAPPLFHSTTRRSGEAAELLYNGPWVAERLAAVKDFLATNAGDFDPTVRTIIEGAKAYDAVAAFEGRYKLEALRQKTRRNGRRRTS